MPGVQSANYGWFEPIPLHHLIWSTPSREATIQYMLTVSTTSLKDTLSECLQRVQDGETILILDEGRIVAELRPPQPGHTPATTVNVWASLVRQGLITPAERTKSRPPPALALIPFEQVMADLDEAREDR